MAYDPLSRSTRKARTTFLVIGTTATFAWSFGIKIEKLDSITIPSIDVMMDVALIIATAYTFIAFLIAYLDDLRHLDDTPLERKRQDKLMAKRNELINLRNKITGEKIADRALSEAMAEPGLLTELGVLEQFSAVLGADKTDRQGALNQCIMDTHTKIYEELEKCNEEMRSKPSDMWSRTWIRLYFFDLCVPLLVLLAAILGWNGWLALLLPIPP